MGGEAQARESESNLMAERGQPEKAPNRAEAVKALLALTKAIEKLSPEEFKKADAKLQTFAGLITPQDTFDALSPIFTAQNPETLAFLESQGWELPVEGQGEKTMIKAWDHTMQYLNSIYGGMNFGPQFRHIHPFRA